jgi:transposase
MLDAARARFAAATAAIRARLLDGTILQSDETGLRVGKQNWWLWVFHHDDSALFVAAPSRAKKVVEDFLGDFRPISGSPTVTAGKWAGRT